MADVPPIPAAIWRRLLTFLGEGRTGQIILDVHHGRVQRATIQERIRPENGPKPPDLSSQHADVPNGKW